MTVRRIRKMRMTSASPTAPAATVMQIVNTVKTIPVGSPLKRAKATRLMFTALSISSMPSRIPMVFRRVTTPNRPMAKTVAASGRGRAGEDRDPADRPAPRDDQPVDDLPARRGDAPPHEPLGHHDGEHD